MTWRAVTAALVVLAVLASGCSDDEHSLADRRRELVELRHTEAVEAGWDQQAEVLADDEVTAAEYDALVASFIECHEAAGVAMLDPVVHPANPRVSITAPVSMSNPGPDIEAANEASDRCRETYLTVEELLWEDPAPMEPGLADAVQACMANTDHPLEDDDDDLLDMARTVGFENNNTLAQCVTSTMRQLYPDLPYVSVALPSLL